MKLRRGPLPLVIVLGLSLSVVASCRTLPPPATDEELRARRFLPAPGKASIYVIRQGAVGQEVMIPVVDERVMGALERQTFLFMEVDPGRHQIFGSYSALDRSPPLVVDLEEGDIAFARILRRYRGELQVTEMEALTDAQGRHAVQTYAAGVMLESSSRRAEPTSHSRARSYEVPEKSALVYVLRGGMRAATKRAWSSSNPGLPLIVDGRVVALIRRKSYIAIELPPGRHSLVATIYKTNVFEPIEVDVEAGRSYFFEVRATGAGALGIATLEQLPAEAAQKQLASGRLVWLDR